MCMYERWRKSYKSSAEILHKQRQKTHTHLVLAKFYPAYELAHRNVAKTKSQRVKDLTYTRNENEGRFVGCDKAGANF